MKQRYNLYVVPNTNFTIGFQFGVIVDTIKDYIVDGTYIANFRSSDRTYSLAVPLTLTGDVWTLALSPDQTGCLSPHRSVFYAIDRTNVDGTIDRVLEGSVEVDSYGSWKR